MMDNPLVSVVVTSYTAERLVDVCDLLESVKKQTYKKIEVVLVIESSGELCDAVKDYIDKESIPGVNVLKNDTEPGANASRNFGIKAAKGEIVAFVDDDVVLFSDWAEEMVKAYEDESVIGVTGPAYPLWMDKPALWLPEHLYWLINCTGWMNWSTITVVRNIWAMNASFRREAFAFGTFNTSLGPQKGGINGWKNEVPEEIELSARIKKGTGKSIVCNPNSKVSHKVYTYKLSLKYMLLHAYLMGLTKYRTKRLYQDLLSSEDILSQEKELLWRILKHEPLRLIKEIFRNPFVACRRIFVVVVILTSLACGYLTGIVRQGTRSISA